MPFRSEKQRRYLWATQPELAKRWAHKYPDSNKGLPMYAHDSDDKKPKAKDQAPELSKQSAELVLRQIVINNLNAGQNSIFTSQCDATTKKSNSKMLHVEMPRYDKPVYEGEKKIDSILKPETLDEGGLKKAPSAQPEENCAKLPENPLLSKLAVVLAPKIQQELENRRAQEEARNAQHIPTNVNVKRYPAQNFTVPPPMGMQPQAAQPAAPQQAPQAPPQQAGQLAPVGGGASPNSNPINSFGGLSSNGDINGNAALGTQNMAGGEKLAAGAGRAGKALGGMLGAAVKATPPKPSAVTQAVQGTFKPGVGELKRTLNNTGRVYADVPSRSVAPGTANLFKQELKGPTTGLYAPELNVAAAAGNPTTGRGAMRHELAHAIQYNTPNKYSLPGIAGSLNSSAPGTWSRAAGRYLGEMHSHAAEAKGFWPQLRNAAQFAFSPAQALSYGELYGPKYMAVHGGAAAGSALAAGAGVGRLINNPASKLTPPPATPDQGGMTKTQSAPTKVAGQDPLLGQIMGINADNLDASDIGELEDYWLDNLRAKAASTSRPQKCSCGCGQKVHECTCPPECSCRQKDGSCYGLELKKQASKPGLWANIHAKRKRGGKPAKPGDKDYPDAKSWNKVTAISEKQSRLTPAEILQASFPVAAGGVGGALLGSYGPLLVGGKPDLATSLGGTAAGSALGMLAAYKKLTGPRKKKKQEKSVASSEKASADENFNVVYPEHKPSYVMPKHLRENVLTPEEAQQVFQAMRGVARHGALDKTRLDWNGLKIRGYSSRVQDNDKITRLGRWMHHTVGDQFEAAHPDQTQGFGDAFFPYSNVVSVPSGMGGTLMHELGHAVDFNAFPSDSTPRHLMAATYRNYAPTLWKEHAAWNKGRRGLLTAFADKKLDPQLAHKVLTNAAGAKKLGLGSYWGGTLGGLVGGGLGLAGTIALLGMARDNDIDVNRVPIPNRLLALPAILGATAGVLGGTGIGHLMARQPVKSEKIVNLMARAMAKKQRISYAEAKQYIESSLATPQAEPPAVAGKIEPAKQRRKAASTPAWQRSEGKNDEGGLNEKGRKSYEREHGGNLKPPVTESNPSGERAKRQNSFCSRMCGMKRVNTGAKTKSDPDSRINKSLRKWNCKCSSAYLFGQQFANHA